MAPLLLALAFVTPGCGVSGIWPFGGDELRLEEVRFQDASQDGQTEDAGTERDSDKPNIVLVSVDDLDLDTARALPRLQEVMSEEGVTFENAFATNPLCCPSRATTLRGQYAQNTLVQGNKPPQGGYEKFHALRRDRSTVATWLDPEGYQTAYMGKYMNGYRGTLAPPGWDEWLAVSGNYESQDLTYNGRLLPDALEGRHETDVLSRKSSLYIERASENREPFFLYVAPRAPHEPAEPAERHEDLFSGEEVPADPAEDPAYNEADISDKPPWLERRQPLTREQKTRMDKLHRNRLRSMKSVEDMLVRIEDKLRQTGELDETYVIFTSDHGYHMGQHRLPIGKWTAYEEDIRVPLMVRGPGVPEGESRDHLVLNNDLAPTFADLAGAQTPDFVDGRSFTPLLGREAPPQEGWREAFLVEAGRFFPGAGAGPPINRPRFDAVRTRSHLYVKYATGARELYDLREDPHQLDNLLSPENPTADPDTVARLALRLEALRGCSGEDCQRAETEIAGHGSGNGDPGDRRSLLRSGDSREKYEGSQSQ